MDRYLVESSHEAGDCDAIIKEIHAAGYLHHFEWGCHDGASLRLGDHRDR